MRTALGIIAFVTLASIGIAGEDVGARIDKLLGRWTSGDDAARAGVAAETVALGEPAVAELYRRLARHSFEFRGSELGATLSEGKHDLDPKRANLIEVTFAKPAADAAFPKRPTVLTEEQAKRLAKGAEVVTAPSLVCYDGQRANVTVSNQRAYTRTIDPRRRPINGTVQSGLMIEMRPIRVEGTKLISVEMRCIRAQLENDAVPTLKTGDGEIGIPVVTKREVAVTLNIASGKTVSVALPGDEPLILRVGATRLEENVLRDAR